MKKHILAILLFILVAQNISFAQTKISELNFGQTFISDIEHFFDIGIGLAKSPASFSANDWYTTATVSGGTVLLFSIDKNARTFALSNQNELNNNIFNFDKYYGSGYTAIFTASIYGYGLFTNNKSVRKLGLDASSAFIYSVAITGVFKVIIGRRRPNAGESQLFFKPFQLTNDTYQSLPSGHTTAAFAVSTVMGNYIENTYWKIFWYGSAGMVGLSRIYHNKHWTSDVFLGAAIGYFVGEFVVNFDRKEKEVLDLKVNPYFTFDRIGVNLKF
jgi:membrane-associated phospholipid phosphatase